MIICLSNDSGAEVTVRLSENGVQEQEVPARIVGIDEYGFLHVSLISQTEDKNSDMSKDILGREQ